MPSSYCFLKTHPTNDSLFTLTNYTRRLDFLKQKGESVKIIQMLPLYFLILTDQLSVAALVDMRNITVMKYELVALELAISDDQPAHWGRSCCCLSCSRRGCFPLSDPHTCT